MGLSHPAIDTRDTALFLPFRRTLRVRANVMLPLRTLVNALMGREFGLHGENPVCSFTIRPSIPSHRPRCWTDGGGPRYP